MYEAPDCSIRGCKASVRLLALVREVGAWGCLAAAVTVVSCQSWQVYMYRSHALRHLNTASTLALYV